MTANATAIRQARHELSAIVGDGVHHMTDDMLPTWYASLTGCSWDALVAFHAPANPEEITAARLKARVKSVLGRDINYGSAVVEGVKVDDNQMIVSLRVFDIREMGRRDAIVGAGVRLIIYTRDDAGVFRQSQSLTAWESNFTPVETVDQYYTVNTPARYESRAWEYFNCYRPGTPNAPMDGPAHDSRVNEVDALFEALIGDVAHV